MKRKYSEEVEIKRNKEEIFFDFKENNKEE